MISNWKFHCISFIVFFSKMSIERSQSWSRWRQHRRWISWRRKMTTCPEKWTSCPENWGCWRRSSWHTHPMLMALRSPSMIWNCWQDRRWRWSNIITTLTLHPCQPRLLSLSAPVCQGCLVYTTWLPIGQPWLRVGIRLLLPTPSPSFLDLEPSLLPPFPVGVVLTTRKMTSEKISWRRYKRRYKTRDIVH
jgi:hypothetical protein